MQIFAPEYYQSFQCSAAACTHSCCVGWEIDVDEDTLARYDALEGALGAEIRRGISRSADAACFTLDAAERCPNLRADGLCRIICELGEGYLCDICREHPRFYHTAGGRLECGVGASCEAAAALILASDSYARLLPVCTCEGEENPSEFDATVPRAALFAMLSDRKLPLSERLAQIAAHFAASLPHAARVRESLLALEYLDEAHRALLSSTYTESPLRAGVEAECERFFAYLVYRHASPAQGAEGFAAAVGMAMLAERLFAALITQEGYTPVRAAVLLSEELEYSEENTAALLAIGV
jgi:lysine-N-methylase